MASSRNKFLYRFHLTAFIVVATLTAVVAWLLLPQGGGAILRGLVVFAAVAIALEQLVVWMLVKQILAPTGTAASVAVRIATAISACPRGARTRRRRRRTR